MRASFVCSIPQPVRCRSQRRPLARRQGDFLCLFILPAGRGSDRTLPQAVSRVGGMGRQPAFSCSRTGSSLPGVASREQIRLRLSR